MAGIGNLIWLSTANAMKFVCPLTYNIVDRAGQGDQPIYKAVMEYCKYNQSRAAIVLGISRGTLRIKLKLYFDEQYVGTRG